MAFWTRLLGLVTGAGYRQKGVQYGFPGTYTNNSATSVTLDTALQLSAVWACVKLVSETIGSLPIVVSRKQKDGSWQPDPTHPLSRLFNGKVNRYQTKQEYFETIAYQNVLLGNDYSVITRDSAGEIISLLPLMTQQMEVVLDDKGAVVFNYTDGSDLKVYSDKTIWHNKLLGNGIIGLNPLAYARNSIGIGQAAEQSTTKIYQNGGKPSGVLSMDKLLTPEQRATARANFKDLTEGEDSRLYVLEAGMNFQAISLSPQDIELLSSRRFQIEDIARFFGVPSVLINDTTASTTWGSGVQEIVQGFYRLGLRPYLSRYVASMKSRLLTIEEQQTIDISFDFSALLRPDIVDRLKVGKESVQGGLRTPNEVRADEGWAAMEGGDKLLVQKQMIPLDKIEDNLQGGDNAKGDITSDSNQN